LDDDEDEVVEEAEDCDPGSSVRTDARKLAKRLEEREEALDDVLLMVVGDGLEAEGTFVLEEGADFVEHNDAEKAPDDDEDEDEEAEDDEVVTVMSAE